MRSNFCPCQRGIDRGFVAMNYVLVKSIFDELTAIGAIEEARAIGFVFREKKIRIAGANQPALAVLRMLEFDARATGKSSRYPGNGSAKILSPGPGIAEPELGKDV